MEAKLKTATCARCKARKTRCDGQDPCISCSAAGITCEYDADARDSRHGIELSKGRACLACRRKKKRCDGQLPCRTCLAGRKRDACEYADGVVVPVPPKSSAPVQTQIIPVANDSPPESHTSDTTPSLSSGSSDSPESQDNIPPIAVLSESDASSTSNGPETEPMTFTTLAELYHVRDMFLENTEKRGLPIPDPHLHWPTLTSGPDVDRPHSPSPFFEGSAPIANPQDDTQELANIRSLFLQHATQFGLSVRTRTLDALARGVADADPNADGLHPAMLHACQLLGYMLVRHLQDDTWVLLPAPCGREAAQLALALDALQLTPTTLPTTTTTACPDFAAQRGPPRPAPSPLASVQTLILLASYFFSKGDIARAREMISSGNDLVREHALDVMLMESCSPSADGMAGEPPRYGFNTAPTSCVAEVQAAVSHLVYLDVSYAITLKLPSVMDPALRENFQTLINRPNKNAEANFVRAKSAFLLFEAQQLAERWWQQNPLTDTEGAQWQSRYWDTMEGLDAHRSYITLALTKMAFCPATHTMGLSLKVCLIMLLTGQICLLSLFSAHNPELGEQKLAAVNEIVRISSIFTEGDCKYLDPILSVCWTSIIGALDLCVALGKGAMEQSMHDIPAMAGVIRQRNKTLQRVLPFAADL
ncbi:hypothetical protein C8R46DRAFT_1092809 [Mycena filopes]|nr:hypothetical protein C8R46DRAFT_1092809 [Mycena filopes]